MQLEKVLITKEGLNRLKEELGFRENVKKKDLVEMLITSKDSGDERENDGFTLAFEDYQINEQRILDLKDVIKYHEIINPKQFKYIELGHTVTLKDEKGNTKIFQIVGEYEIDVLNGKITLNSPIAQSILGLEVGNKVIIKDTKYEILRIF